MRTPIELPKPMPPPPGPLPKPRTGVKITTDVKAPFYPRVMKGKSGNPAQVYLGNIDDMRDLDTSIEGAKSQLATALAAASAYADLLERQRRLLASRAISREEYEQSVFDLENARAATKVQASQILVYQARYDQKAYQAKVAAKKITFDLETFYGLYTREWEAQCEVSRAATQAAQAQLNLNRFEYNMVVSLYRKRAAAYYEVQQRWKDLVAAESDVGAKHALDVKCPLGLPSLAELKAMQSEAGAEPAQLGLR